MGGARQIPEVIYEEIEDDDLFRHIAWELPKRNKVIPDDEFKSHRENSELYRSSVLSGQAKKLQKSKYLPDSQISSPYKLGFNAVEPQRIILDEEELENEHESQHSQKNLVNHPYMVQAASTFKMSEKMEPKQFEEDDMLENNSSFEDKPYQKPQSKSSLRSNRSKNYEKFDKNEQNQKPASNVSLSNNAENPKKVALIGFSETSVQDKVPLDNKGLPLDKNEMSHEQIHTPVSNEHPSKKSIHVFRPPPKEDDDQEVVSNENQEMILPKTPLQLQGDVAISNSGSRRSSKSKKNEELVKGISNQQSEKNSRKGSVHQSLMHQSLAPILEHPDEHRYKYDPNRKVANL